jgi:hypothetical protein
MKRKSSNIKVKSNIEDKKIVGILKTSKLNKKPSKSQKVSPKKSKKNKSVKFTPGTKDGNIMLDSDINNLFKLKYHKFSLHKKVIHKINKLLSELCNQLIKYSIFSIEFFSTKNILSNLNMNMSLNILFQKSKNNLFSTFEKEIKKVEKLEKNEKNEKFGKNFSLVKIKKYVKDMTNIRISEEYIITLAYILNYFCIILFKILVNVKKTRLEKIVDKKLERVENEIKEKTEKDKILKIGKKEIDYEIKEVDFNIGIRQDLEIKNFIKYFN